MSENLWHSQICGGPLGKMLVGQFALYPFGWSLVHTGLAGERVGPWPWVSEQMLF